MKDFPENRCFFIEKLATSEGSWRKLRGKGSTERRGGGVEASPCLPEPSEFLVGLRHSAAAPRHHERRLFYRPRRSCSGQVKLRFRISVPDSPPTHFLHPPPQRFVGFNRILHTWNRARRLRSKLPECAIKVRYLIWV